MFVEVLMLCSLLAPTSANQVRVQPLTLAELRRLPRNCPIIYDNDWLRDVTDDEYLFAKAHLGQANLRGIILTKDLWDQGRLYKVEQGLNDFNENIAIARRSGWRGIPDVTVGSDRVFERPASGRIEDTKPIPSAGAELIVREARRATSAKPLIVVVGGPLNTVASAYLMDPAIANRMIVLMTDIGGYNGQDKWANYIVTTRCRLANFGAHPIWWPQRPQTPMMPLERFDALPDREVTREIRRVARLYWERSTRKDNPDRDDGFGDGAGLFLFFRPETWREVRRVRVNGPESQEYVTEGVYHYLDAWRLDFDLMREEFFATIAAALAKRR
ncbi:MAG: hypothetical protein ACUVTZ_07060 [Armatimonadota bacterium]